MSDLGDNGPTEAAQAESLEQEKMHGWDFAFSIVVMLFALGVIGNSLTMPFSGTVGGITTEWYESPGLLPLFIGCALFLAGLSVFVKSVKASGKALFMKHVGRINPTSFLIAGGGILTYIFVLITWYDFFLASTVFLLFYIGLYYLDQPELTRQLLKIFYITAAGSILLFATGMDRVVNSGYEFTTDIFLVVTAAALIITMVRAIDSREMMQKVRRLVILSLIFPLVLCPIFRYFLLVPLPNEGLVVEQIMNKTYYTYIATSTVTEEAVLSEEDLQALEDAF